MRTLISTLVVAVALVPAALAADNAANLCAKNWRTAQNGSGATFATRSDCARARDVYLPSLTVSSPAVTAGQLFTASGTGFHPSTAVTLSFAVTGQPPYFSTGDVTDAAGGVVFGLVFFACGARPPDELTLTLTDSYGVHASTSLRLC